MQHGVGVGGDRQKKFGYGEEWKRSVGLIKLILRFSRELTKTGKY